jgi:hypothetical protein
MRFPYRWYHESKVYLWTQGIYTAPQHHSIFTEFTMNAATITQAQEPTLRHDIGALFIAARNFCEELFTAHGGWFVRRDDALAGRREMLALAAESEAHSPNLAAELRYFANR